MPSSKTSRSTSARKPAAAEKPAAPNPQTAQRVMLLLPGDLVTFVDQLAKDSAQPGVPLNRQDAIRSVLAKLRQQMAEAAE